MIGPSGQWGQQLRELIPESGSVLVAGGWECRHDADAVGPLAADSVLITRHLIAAMPRQFPASPGGGAANRRTGRYRRGVR